MKKRWSSGLFYLLLGSLCVLLLKLSVAYDFRTDLSLHQQNSLHSSSLALLQDLQGPLALTAFVPDYPVMRADIHKLVDKYRQVYPDTRLEFIDPSSHPDLARKLGIRQLGEMLVEYNGRQEKLDKIDEPSLSNAIARLSLDNSGWIVSVAGHGEASLYGNANFELADFHHKLQQQGYKSIAHTLSATGQLPGNTSTLLLAAPQTPLSEPEVQILLDYLEQGGNLLWLADGQIPQSLAEYLSLSFLPGTVVDAAAADLGIDTPTIAIVSQYPDHPLTSALQGPVLLPHARAMQQRTGTTTEWQHLPLLQTGARSWNETGSLTGTLQRQSDLQEVAGPLVLGYVLTRKSRHKEEQRVVVIGDADLLSNAYLGNGANPTLGVALLHWLTANDQLVKIPPRESSSQHLHWSASTTATVALFYLVIAPVLLLSSGLFIYWWRRRA